MTPKKNNWIAWVLALPLVLVVWAIGSIWFHRPPSNIGSPPDLVKTEYLNVDGIGRVAYWKVAATAPKRTSYPMLFLQGGPGIGIDQGQVRNFSKRYPDFDIYFLDQIGVGASDRLPRAALTLENSVEAINQFSSKVIGEQAIVVGVSWGAAIAARFAVAHPEHVRALLLSSPGALPEVCALPTTDRAPECTESLLPSITATIAPYPMERLATPNGAEAKTIEPDMPSSIPNGRSRVQKDRLWLADTVAGFSPTLSQMILPLNRRYKWEEECVNPEVNITLRRLHQANAMFATREATNIPTLILRGDLDFVSVDKVGGYQVLFPKARFVLLRKETHDIVFLRCAPVMEARVFLATYSGSAKPKSCTNKLVPISGRMDRYTLQTSLKF
jgi:pimeloyl-ACP methyl ester carboxylesterase